MKKPLNYRLQMYRALAEFVGLGGFFVVLAFSLYTFGVFMQKVHIFK